MKLNISLKESNAWSFKYFFIVYITLFVFPVGQVFFHMAKSNSITSNPHSESTQVTNSNDDPVKMVLIVDTIS